MTESHARSIAAIGLILLIVGGHRHRPAHCGSDRCRPTPSCWGCRWRSCCAFRTCGIEAIGSAPRYLLGPAALLFLLMAVLSVAWNGAKADSYLTVVRYASYLLLAFVVSIVTQDAAFRRLIAVGVGAQRRGDDGARLPAVLEPSSAHPG